MHKFTPDLPRDHVHTGRDSCAECEELRGTHRGDRAVARRHSWSARVVAAALRDLAAGKSYAQVSRDARRVTNRSRTRVTVPGSRRKYTGAALSANAWHTAADWVEAFAPVLWDDLEPRLRQAEAAAVVARDRAGEPGPKPMVLLLDDIPINVGARRDWFVLVAAQVQWVGGAVPGRQVKLRLVRGYPSNDHHAWKLLLAELGYIPDFVLADAGTGLVKAVSDVYGPGVPLLPSLFHLRQAVEFALQRTPGARLPTGTKVTLQPELARHLLTLRRSSLTSLTAADWTGWWDRLEALLAARGLPVEKVRARRTTYEPQVAALLPVYRRYPQLPVATGGLEIALKQRIEPVLAGRAHAFGNVERTNRLFDLVVCRDWHVFDDQLAVADMIRRDNEANSGWATPLRYVADRRSPSGRRYSSLRDQHLLRERARTSREAS